MSKSRLKLCGHFGCTLQYTANCCGCEDRRGAAISYLQYIDGFGCVWDRSANSRCKKYCPVCRNQFEKLVPGLKRCGCEIEPVACGLWDPKCCACLDIRDEDAIYGEGKGIFNNGTRWMHYCAECKERVTPPTPEVDEPLTEIAVQVPCVAIGDNVSIGKDVVIDCYTSRVFRLTFSF
jgi:hypothetical protein